MSSALVKVNEQNAQRLDRYFRKQLPAENSSQPSFEAVEVEVTLPGAGAGGGDIVTKRNGNHYVAPDAEALSYDDDGNLVSDGRWVYIWDGENRLTVMETTTAAVSAGVPKRKLAFAYDGQNRRICKQVYHWDAGSSSWTLNSERRFVYDQWNLVAEVDASGDLLKSHVWGMDLSQTAQGAGGVGGLLWSNDYESGKTHFVVYDGNGNVTAMVNASTIAVDARYDYEAFGRTVLIEGGEIAEGNTFRFSTKYEDAETGLYYYGFRYYNPETGRWLGRDPIGEHSFFALFTKGMKRKEVAKFQRDSLSMPYNFVGNNPVTDFDILGLARFEVDSQGLHVHEGSGSGKLTYIVDVQSNGSWSVRAKPGHEKEFNKAKAICHFVDVVNDNSELKKVRSANAKAYESYANKGAVEDRGKGLRPSRIRSTVAIAVSILVLNAEGVHSAGSQISSKLQAYIAAGDGEIKFDAAVDLAGTIYQIAKFDLGTLNESALILYLSDE